MKLEIVSGGRRARLVPEDEDVCGVQEHVDEVGPWFELVLAKHLESSVVDLHRDHGVVAVLGLRELLGSPGVRGAGDRCVR